MMAQEQSGEAKKNAPPYIAYQTLKTLAGSLKQHGVPPRIDRSLMSNFSGAVQSQLMTALRFLNLIDDSEAPTLRFKKLVDAHGSDAWPSALAEVLKHGFAEIFKLNLATATPALLYDTFKDAYAGEGDTLRKSITFFLNAAADAQIQISPYITKNKKPRSAPTKRRGPGKAKSRNAGTNENRSNEFETPPVVERKLSEQVLAVLDDNPEKDVQDAVFVLLKYLRKEGK
jgi:hypothetical protein